MEQDTQYVTIAELARQMNLDKSNARKWIISQGYVFTKVRDPKSHQLVLALPVDEAESVIELRQNNGYSGMDKPFISGPGYFYIVQIMPDVIPNRVKFGYANDCNNRMRAYLTVSPTAQLLKCWPSQLSWEQAAIASLTRVECKHIGGEVFECESLDTLIQRGNEFFTLLPAV